MSHLLIAGAGAAGLTAAGAALEWGHTVTLVEHSDLAGKKILVTGKGRCNVTNDCDDSTFLQHVRANPRFLYSALKGFGTADTMALFEGLGVPLKVERGRRVFPASDKAEDIRQALLRYADGAEFVQGSAETVLLRDGRACGLQLSDGRRLYADFVLLATGGCSYPSTGSTGIGYRMAAAVGHTIVPPVPSLVALVERGSTCKRMMGLSLRNVTLTLKKNGEKVFSEQGEMLFTHFGLSGPLTLSASTCLERDMSKHRYTVSIDWKPALDEAALDGRLLRDFEAASNRECAHALDKLLPKSAIPVFLERWGVEPAMPVNQITREQRRALIALLKDFTVEIGGRGDLEHAVITSGGVDVKEVSPKTMESKLVPGLFFAGELLDLDAVTGGYNLQIAFSTAMAVARNLEWV